MVKDFSRSDRVAQQMQRELAELIRMNLKDPRLGLVTLTDVEVTRDLSHAKVFYTVMTGDAADTHKVLTSSSGFLRAELGRRIKLFKMPELHFEYDHSIERGMNLDRLIDQAMHETGPADEAGSK